MEIVELARGRTRAVVLPAAGGRLQQLSIHDGRCWQPLLHSPASPAKHLADPIAGGSFAMLPWPGRIDGARFLFDGRLYRVPVTEGAHGLHGRGVYLPWTLESQTRTSCRLSLVFDDGWPFPGSAVHEIALREDGIVQRIEVHAAPNARFPAGAGWHPWFRRHVRGHGVHVLVNAERVYETAEMIPTGWLAPAKDALDLRRGPELGARRLDACYRHPRGPLTIRWGDIHLSMRSSPNVTHAVVYTPKHAVCVEPQTCAPDAFNLAAQGVGGTGLVIVDSRHPLIATSDWRWTIGS